MDRNWRDAKIPQWIKDQIADEMRAQKLTIALSWPTEPKPEPLPFRWGEYDMVRGEPREGVFYGVHRNGAYPVHIKKNDGTIGSKWKGWAFSNDGEMWGTTVERGPLFATERDATLYVLWAACEEYAAKLAAIRGRL